MTLILSLYQTILAKSELEKYTEIQLVDKIREDPYSVIVYQERDQIKAFCFSRFDDYLIWLEWFGIKKELRSKGISKIIIEKLIESAKERGCHKIWCDCRTDNIVSIKSLLSNGFFPITTISNHWYGQDFLLFQKYI